MATSSNLQPKRKHVTTACISCRESKVKCDGATPACQKCLSKGKDCCYQAGDDKRKVALRVAIELLSGRVDQLCQYIESNGLQCPKMLASDEKVLNRVLSTLGLAQGKPRVDQGWEEVSREQIVQENSFRMNSSQATGTEISGSDCGHDGGVQAHDYPRQPSQQNLSAEAYVQAGVHQYNISGQTTTSSTQIIGQESPTSGGTAFGGDNLFTWNDSIGSMDEIFPLSSYTLGNDSLGELSTLCKPDHPLQLSTVNRIDAHQQVEDNLRTESTGNDLVDQLSNRMGKLHVSANGHIRYYGATSNFNLIDMPDPDNLTVHRTARVDGPKYLKLLNIDKDAPLEIESHLVNLYFTWQDPTFHVVNRGMYEKAKTKWLEEEMDTIYYSEALRNAMCALGAAFETRYHPSFVTFPRSLADYFADRAKALLEIELDCPTIATVQAMVVLSAHDLGCKRDARGWLYSGMAMRLAFDLALHVDMSSYVISGAISAEEESLRRTVFWGAYTVEFYWGYYLGRSFRVSIGDVSVEKPNYDHICRDPRFWVSYVSPGTKDTSVTVPDHMEEVSRQRILLCEIMAPLGHILYGCSNTPANVLTEYISKTDLGLSNWKASLPTVLQVDMSTTERTYLPHVLLLHMQYHQYVIHTFRPCMSKSGIGSDLPRGSEHSQARNTCIDSAIDIAKLLHLYEMQYTLRRMNIQGVAITCSAALLLIFGKTSKYQNHEESELAMHLSTCFRALEEFSPCWESSKRAREFLIRLQKEWESWEKVQKSRNVSSHHISSPGQMTSTSDHSRKRARTLSTSNTKDDEHFHVISNTHKQAQSGHRGPGGAMGSETDWDFAWDSLPPRGTWDNWANSIPNNIFG